MLVDRFLEFEDPVTVQQLQEALAQDNPGIMILRYSKLTGTVKIRADKRLSKKQIRRAFSPYKIRKIYNDLPLEKNSD